jgi:hypothetical protein
VCLRACRKRNQWKAARTAFLRPHCSWPRPHDTQRGERTEVSGRTCPVSYSKLETLWFPHSYVDLRTSVSGPTREPWHWCLHEEKALAAYPLLWRDRRREWRSLLYRTGREWVLLGYGDYPSSSCESLEFAHSAL